MSDEEVVHESGSRKKKIIIIILILLLCCCCCLMLILVAYFLGLFEDYVTTTTTIPTTTLNPRRRFLRDLPNLEIATNGEQAEYPKEKVVDGKFVPNDDLAGGSCTRIGGPGVTKPYLYIKLPRNQNIQEKRDINYLTFSLTIAEDPDYEVFNITLYPLVDQSQWDMYHDLHFRVGWKPGPVKGVINLSRECELESQTFPFGEPITAQCPNPELGGKTISVQVLEECSTGTSDSCKNNTLVVCELDAFLNVQDKKNKKR